jgi:hypothetical protein
MGLDANTYLLTDWSSVWIRKLVTEMLVNPIIRTRTHYFRHAYPQTHDNIFSASCFSWKITFFPLELKLPVDDWNFCYATALNQNVGLSTSQSEHNSGALKWDNNFTVRRSLLRWTCVEVCKQTSVEFLNTAAAPHSRGRGARCSPFPRAPSIL